MAGCFGCHLFVRGYGSLVCRDYLETPSESLNKEDLERKGAKGSENGNEQRPQHKAVMQNPGILKECGPRAQLGRACLGFVLFGV